MYKYIVVYLGDMSIERYDHIHYNRPIKRNKETAPGKSSNQTAGAESVRYLKPYPREEAVPYNSREDDSRGADRNKNGKGHDMKKYNLSRIMFKAWELFRKMEISFSEALHRAWTSAKATGENQARIKAAKAAAGITEETATWSDWRKPYDIQTVQSALEKSGSKTQTVNDNLAHLSHVFSAAVKDETLDRNPCKCIENLQRSEKPARETIHRALSKEETSKFFEAAKGSYFENMFKLMIQTGVRVGEMGALSLFDVNSKENMLHIHKTVTRDESGRYYVGDTPKTDAGNRDIPLTDQIKETINAQRELNRIVFGNVVHDTIFRSVEGALLREYEVNREIERICKRTGIERFTNHAFRATFATRFIEQRPQDYKILSEILGHSNIKITLNLYTHVMKDSKIEAMRGVTIAI